jgi:hypothetical protein
MELTQKWRNPLTDPRQPRGGMLANDVCKLRRRKLRQLSAAVATSREGHH